MIQLLPIFAILLAAPRLSYWDITSRRLPNRITLPLISLSFFVALLSFEVERIAIASIVAIVTFLVGWGLSYFNALGMGDVKLLAAIALALSYFSIEGYLIALVIGLVSATAVSAVQLLLGKINKSSSIALGPYLLLGFAIASIETIANLLFTAGV